ncbi:MAG: 50S ribosomal protein L4 [Saprospiraceae bacterium]|nr:50S ribosomal protein L4 [Saprospiraceae bacterium]
MKLDILNIKGEATGRSIELPIDIFGIEPNEHAMYLAVKQYLAHQRQGTHKSKERSEMSGSTRKLHKQKGTGGARKGDINSPTMVGGGRAFGPKPHDYVVKLNKKVRQLARKSAFSVKASSNSIVIVEDFVMETPKTKDFSVIVEKLNVNKRKAILVTPELDNNLIKSSRNLTERTVSRACDLNTYQIMNTNTLIICEKAVAKIVETFSN